MGNPQTRKQKKAAIAKNNDENLAKRANDGDSDGDHAVNKRVKTFQPFAVKYDKAEAVKFKASMRKWVIPEVKFLANEVEAKKCMKIAVVMTNHYEEKGLNKLSDEELDLQIEEYYDKYGGECVRKFVNTQRNQLAQALRKVHLKLSEKDEAVPSKALEAVITRNPELLLLKPTKFKEGDTKAEEKKAENKEVNDENKKHRKRFLTYIDELLPAATPAGIWNEEQRREHMLYCCQHMVAGELKDVVPVEEEAMVLVMLENYEQTWAWQALVRKEEGIEIEAHKKKIGSEKFYKLQPETLILMLRVVTASMEDGVKTVWSVLLR